MVQPINYMSDIQTPFQAAMQGYQAGAAIRNDQQQQAERAAAQQQQQQMRKDVSELMSNQKAGPRDFAAMTLKYPALKDAFKQSSEMLSDEKKKNFLGHGGQVYAALGNGQPEIAKNLLNDRAEAMKNSGDEQGYKSAQTILQAIDVSPALAKNMITMAMVGLDDKFASSLATVGAEARAQDAAPVDLATKKAEAKIKGVEAGVAEATYGDKVAKPALENRKTFESIETAQADREIAKLDVQIKQANSQTQRGQLELEREKLVADRDAKKQAAGVAAQDQLDTLTQSLSTVDSLMKHPGLNSTLGLGGVGSMTGKLSALVPGTDATDFRAMVETLKSQQFLTAASQMKGMGALSDAEGARLERAVSSLSTDQSPAAFKNTLGVIRTTIEKGQAKLVAAGKLPTEGGAFLMKHPTYGDVTDGKVNDLLKKFPGATREQVMQYLQETGGKSAAGAN